MSDRKLRRNVSSDEDGIKMPSAQGKEETLPRREELGSKKSRAQHNLTCPLSGRRA